MIDTELNGHPLTYHHQVYDKKQSKMSCQEFTQPEQAIAAFPFVWWLSHHCLKAATTTIPKCKAELQTNVDCYLSIIVTVGECKLHYATDLPILLQRWTIRLELTAPNI